MQSILRPLSIVLLSQHHWCPWGSQHIIFNTKSTNKHCKSYSTSSTALNGGHISKQDQPRRHCYISKNYITINIRLFNPETGAEAIWSCLSIDPFSQQFSSALNESVSVPQCLYWPVWCSFLDVFSLVFLGSSFQELSIISLHVLCA